MPADKPDKCSHVRMCPRCLAELTKEQVPPYALVNFNWVGPLDFDLTVAEACALNVYRVCVHIFILKPLNQKRTLPTGQLQRHCQGNTIAVPHDPAKAVKAKYFGFQEFCEPHYVFLGRRQDPSKVGIEEVV